jgi:hypothetical protein
MIGVGGRDWKHYVHRKPQVVKCCVHKGILDCLRGLVWQLVSSNRDLLLMNQGVYEVLVFCRLFSLLGNCIYSNIEIAMLAFKDKRYRSNFACIRFF